MGDLLLKASSMEKKKLGYVALGMLATASISLSIKPKTSMLIGRMEGQADKKNKRGRTKKIEVGSLVVVLRKVLKEALGPREWANVTGLALSLISRSYISVWIANNMGQCIEHFCRKEWKQVAATIKTFAGVTAIAALINAALKYFTDVLAQNIRQRLTQRAHTLYMERMNYYCSNHVGDDKFENCDQLICEDIKKFSIAFAEVYSQSLKPVFDFALFSIMLARMMGSEGPLGMYTWFYVAVAVSARVVLPYGQLAAHEQLLEGRFRARHVTLKQNAEMVAFMRGEKPERNLLDQFFKQIRRHSNRVASVKLLADFVQGYVNKYLASVVGLGLTIRPVMINYQGMGAWTPAQIAKYYVQCRQILENLANAVLALFELQKRIGALSGLSARVATLFDGLRHRNPILKQEIEANRLANPARIENDCEILEFNHVDVYKPDGVLLLKDLCIKVEPGVRVIITGDNGCGKSSLFRIMCGLWPLVAGNLRRPTQKKIYFLSQVNFVPVGSLRDVITYPKEPRTGDDRTDEDDWLHQVLEWAHLKGFKCDGLAPSLDDVLDWNTVLSPGQKQRMAFARLLYARPTYAILDECTNGISPEIEGDLYRRLSSQGMAIFSISHKIELKKHHDYELHFHADETGGYTWTKLNREPVADI